MIEEQYVSFDTAKLLREAGFKANCAFILDDNQERLYRPTQELAARWLREIHHYAVCVWFSKDHEKWFYAHGNMDNIMFDTDYCISEYIYDSYEEAFEAGLQEALKLIIKNK